MNTSTPLVTLTLLAIVIACYDLLLLAASIH